MFPLLFAATTAANLIHSLSEQSQAKKGLASLKAPKGYEVTPEQQHSYDRAEKLAMNGYSPEEKAAFAQNMAQQSNAGYRRAMAFGGNNLAGAIQAGINYGNTGALTNFAAQDAALKRQNIHYADSVGNQITQQKNKNTSLNWQNYNTEAQAYGHALKSSKENFFNSLNLFGASFPNMGSSLVGGNNNETQSE